MADKQNFEVESKIAKQLLELDDEAFIRVMGMVNDYIPKKVPVLEPLMKAEDEVFKEVPISEVDLESTANVATTSENVEVAKVTAPEEVVAPELPLTSLSGCTRLIARSHTENDAFNGAYKMWKDTTWDEFSAVVLPQIERLQQLSVPFDIGCTYDFVTWCADKKVGDKSFLSWLVDNGVTLSTRAHASSKSNAADAAWALEQQGIKFNGTLASCDGISEFVNDDGSIKPQVGKLHPEATYAYTTIVGIAPLDADGKGTHSGVTSFPASIYRAAAGSSVIVVQLGRESSVPTASLVSRSVVSGQLTTGLEGVMCNMGRAVDYDERVANLANTPNAGPCDFMSTPSGNHTNGNGGIVGNVTGGKPYASEIERLVGDLAGKWTFSTVESLVNDWIAAGEPVIQYDAATLSKSQPMISADKTMQGKVKDNKIDMATKTFTLVQGVKDHSVDTYFTVSYSVDTEFVVNGVVSTEADFVAKVDHPTMIGVTGQLDAAAMTIGSVTKIENVSPL